MQNMSRRNELCLNNKEGKGRADTLIIFKGVNAPFPLVSP
jgi:hypothetical protein